MLTHILKTKNFILITIVAIIAQGCEKAIELPVSGTKKALLIGATAATIEGYIEFNGNSEEIESGVCVSEQPNPGFNDQVQYNKKKTFEPFQIVVQDLKPMTTYYARAFARNSKGVSFGKVISFRTGDKEIGEEYQGGNVFYILQPGDKGFDSAVCHGLICTPNNKIADLVFSTIPVSMGAQGSEIGDGEQNTQSLIDVLVSEAKGAYYCNSLNFNGYIDWFLPSIKELTVLMEANSSFISQTQGWVNFMSSTEADQYYYYSGRMNPALGYYYYDSEYFLVPITYQLTKDGYTSRVWPIRKF